MWALEILFWKEAEPDGLDLYSPILPCDSNSEVACYANGVVLLRQRGDCQHLLHVRRASLTANTSGDRVLLHCLLCERTIDTHVSEIPESLIGEIELLLPRQVHWCCRHPLN